MKLFEALWRSPDEIHQIAVKDAETEKFYNIPVKDVAEALSLADKHDQAGDDVYFACAEYLSPDNRKATNASGAFAFWMDFDCGEKKAAQDKGYATIEDAEAAIEHFCKETGLPLPTHVVESGGGLHVYWVLDALLPREEWRESATKIKALTQTHGLLADPSRTADIASVLRIPGTLNHKYDPPRPVVLQCASDRFIDSAAMLNAVDRAHQVCCKPPSSPSLPQASPDDSAGAPQYGLADLKRLASALKVLDPDCDEETWKLHRIAPLARQASAYPKQTDALQRLTRSWSSGELRGEPSTAWTTPGRSNGETGEAVFDAVWRRFLNDSYGGKQTTLGTLYHDAREAGWVDPESFIAEQNTDASADDELDALAFIQKHYALIDIDGRLWVLDRRKLTRLSEQDTAKPLVLSNRSDGNLLIVRAIREKYPEVDQKEIAKDFFSSPETTCHSGVEFNPTGTTEGYLNIWVGPTVVPASGDWTGIRNFLLEVICDGDESAHDYLIRYLAHALQCPGEKPGVMIILLGGQGTGKGTFGRILHSIWGATYLQVHKVDAVTGNFNASLEGALWVFLDEALFVGDRRSSDSLKSLVTEPVILINQKHQPARQSRSYHRFVAATNAEHFKFTERDDRRDFTLRVSEDRKGDLDYWKALYREISGDGVAAMVHDLLAMDLSEFNVRDKPETKELMAQKLRSLEPIPRWWHECLLSGEISEDEAWPEFISTDKAIEGVVDTAGGRLFRKPSASDLVSTMSKLCPSARKKQQKEDYKRKRGLGLPSLQKARAEFEDYIGGEVPW